MPATPLPPSGDRPTPAATCDASGMAEIHRMFRMGFGEAPDLIAGVEAADVEHAGVVADQLDLLSVGLHGHHQGEDERLWDVLAERAPGCAAHVERMKAQHAEMLVHLSAIDDAVPAWRLAPTPSTAAPLLAAIAGVNAALAVHLPDEETNIVPVMETVITEPEVEWFAEHGRRSIPKGQSWYAMGLILASQPDGGDAWLRKNLPAPARLAWRWIGRPRYAARRAALEGR